MALPAETVLFGEISLSGEVRPVGQSDVRLKEAAKLGFTKAVTARASKKRREAPLAIEELRRLDELVQGFYPGGADRL